MELLVISTSISISLIIVLLVLVNNPKSYSNRLFALLAFFLALYPIFNSLTLHSNDQASASLWSKFILFVAIPAGPLFYLFIRIFPKDKLTIRKRTLIILGIWVTINLLLSFFDLVFKVKLENNNVSVIPGPAIPSFGLLQASTLILGSFELIKKYKDAKGPLKNQLRFITYGITLGLGLLLFTTFVLTALLNNTSFTVFTPLFITIATSSVAYSIIRHKFFDIRIIVARAITYLLLIALIATFFTVSTVVFTSFLLKQSTNKTQVIVFVILTLIIAFTFQTLKKFFERITDKVFFKQDYDSNQLLSNLTKIMAETVLIDDIAHKLLYEIIFQMRLSRGSFVLTDAGKIFVTESQGYKRGEEPNFSEKDVFSLQALDKNLIFEELEEGPAKELMRKLELTIVIPLRTQVDHVGLLLLGEKSSGEIYSSKDIKVLEIFAPEAAISFENAKSVEKIRRFNITLKEQVERATSELRDANEQLKDLDKLKDEFLSIASHDLRTPMTAIKGYLWMALNGRAGQIENPALKRYLDISYTSSERMISLINDLLNVSRIKAGRMQMVFENIDFKTIVDQVFAELASKATEKSIELKYEGVKDLPHVIADKQKMAEVLQNLVGNALKFTPEKGKIIVATKLSREKGFVEVAVSDTGVGLSKEDAAKLFEKYARVEQSYKAAKTTGGTGLGLYITKNYVEMHSGKIWVQSELGKGTTFRFTLRIFDKEIAAKMNEENQKKQGSATVPQANTSTAKEAVASSVR